jgi:uncharacterized membrane protein YdjX (TVP38/TMEM64 family)
METFLSFLDYIKINVEYNFILTFLIFFIFLIFYCSFSIPGNPIFITATGYFFGIYIGYFISIISLVLGSLIFFSFFNFFIRKIFTGFINKYVNNLNKYISNSSIEYLIIFRIIPGTPLFLQNLLLSFLKITKKKFILTSFIGFTPLVFLMVFIGNQLNDIDKLKNLSINDFFSFKFLIFIFFFIIFLLIRIFYKKK